MTHFVLESQGKVGENGYCGLVETMFMLFCQCICVIAVQHTRQCLVWMDH